MIDKDFCRSLKVGSSLSKSVSASKLTVTAAMQPIPAGHLPSLERPAEFLDLPGESTAGLVPFG